MIIDTHCHYDMFENPLQLIQECEKQKIITMGMTNLPSHFEMGVNHIKGFKYIRLALGLHPLMSDNHSSELIRFQNSINKTSYIGEVGLDFSNEGINTKDKQIESFEFVLNSIKGKNKIVSLHSRKAELEVLMLLKKYNIENAIFHWYSGSLIVLKSIIESGFYFSINTAMITSIAGRKIISAIPINKILTETDSPYVQYLGKPAKPENVKVVIRFLANYYNKSHLDVENQVFENFNKLINKIR